MNGVHVCFRGGGVHPFLAFDVHGGVFSPRERFQNHTSRCLFELLSIKRDTDFRVIFTLTLRDLSIDTKTSVNYKPSFGVLT